MVHKIKFLILFIIFAIMCFLAHSLKGHTETNLLKTLLPQTIVKSTDIVSIAGKSSSVIKVIFESEEESNIQILKNEFLKHIDTNYFEVIKPDISGLINSYVSHPTNFLSLNTKNLLKSEKYDDVYKDGIERLYSPAGIQLSTPDKDPYLLLDDFVISNRKMSDVITNIDGKYYDFLSLKIKNSEGLSPNLSNKEIKKLVKVQKELSCENSKIYLAGSPIHSFYTSEKSIIDINIICLISTILIIFLTYYYFRNVKILLPVILSILFGMLAGYTATKLLFHDFQIITMVFSTALIGIGIDYSYHYFFSQNHDKTFIKNLSFSLITTVIPFILLFLTGIELLEQIAVFTVFGLITIYLFVLSFYSYFKVPVPQKNISLNLKFAEIILIILCVLCFAGFMRLKFNDSLTALYSPSKNLKSAESLYSKVSGEISQNTQIITVKSDNLENIIEKEEIITEKLIEESIDYISLSKFLPSIKSQKENFDLVKNLYTENLDKFSEILSKKQIFNLKNEKFVPVYFELSSYPYLSEFMLNKNTSLIFAYTDKNLQFDNDYSKVINVKSDIETYIKKYRRSISKIFPLAIVLLIFLLADLYGLKNSIKLLTPPILGIFGAAGLTCLIMGEMNLFSIISIFLVLGFTMDYSIFRFNGEQQTENAILVSGLTTSLSFLMLSLAGFKLLSSISVVLFFGIVIAYLSGYVIFRTEK